MRRFLKYFLRGLIVIAPVVVTPTTAADFSLRRVTYPRVVSLSGMRRDLPR